MPTYEYQCEQCHKEFDIFQGINDAPKTECEECGGKLTKLLSAGTGLIFKGSGFYITDYKANSPASTSKKPESTGCSGGSCPAAPSTTTPKD